VTANPEADEESAGRRIHRTADPSRKKRARDDSLL